MFLAFLMFHCYFFIFLSLTVIPITILIMFTIDFVMPIILLNITANICNLNLLACFPTAYIRDKLSLIVMFSLTSLNVYDMVRFKIPPLSSPYANTLNFQTSRHALFFLLAFSCLIITAILFFLHFKFIQLIRSGDAEIQPGPIKNALKFCHWNLNPVLAHDRIKVSLLEAYNSVYHHNILVLGETYLLSDTSNDEN